MLVEQTSLGGSKGVTRLQRSGFWLGLAAGALPIAMSPPAGLTIAGMRLLGVTLVVGIWWITEALPLAATALVPLAAFPLLGVMSAKETAPAYASSLIMLLLGGFLVARAVEQSKVHRRVALHVLLRVGTSPRRLVLGFEIAAALLSMWISNTATALIMLPVALAVADRATERASNERDAQRFTLAVLLGTGYAASVGGMGTPVGTPPNLVAISAMQVAFPDRPPMTFVSWAAFAVPVVVIVVPLVWLLLTRVYPKVPRSLSLGEGDVIRQELAELGPWRSSEVRSLGVFGLAAVLWVTRPDLVFGPDLTIPGWAGLLGVKGVDDSTVAILCACIAFAMPSGEARGERLLTWKNAVQVPWGLVLLFGGGVALSHAFDTTGLSQFVGARLALLADRSDVFFVGVSTLAVTLGTEIVSNTALSTIAMPILAGTAQATKLDPRLLLVPTALACSCAFMMPAATGPNAIMFGSGRVRIGEMVRAGFLTNFIAWIVIFAAALIAYR